MKTFEEITSSEKFINVMSVIMLVLSIIFALGTILFFIYAIASCIAFNSLIPTIIFGLTFVCAGLSVSCFGYYYRKKLKKEKQKNNETKIEKITTWSIIKEYMTFANFGLTFVIIGAVLFFASIGLGSLKKTNWNNAISNFKAENGYYTQSVYININYNMNAEIDENGDINYLDINKIDISLNNKYAVIVYSDDVKYLKIVGFELYDGELTLNNVKDGVLYLEESKSPRKGEALDNMFWFIFDGSRIEKQIIIYIPNSMKNAIETTGDYITAK